MISTVAKYQKQLPQLLNSIYKKIDYLILMDENVYLVEFI